MGIDVYLLWDGMSESEKKGQYCGFDPTKGDIGYLREAYHGGPYATHALISEDWDHQPEGGFVIPNAVLRERLPRAMEVARERERCLYNGDRKTQDRMAESYADFVALHGVKEGEGKHPRVLVSY